MDLNNVSVNLHFTGSLSAGMSSGNELMEICSFTSDEWKHRQFLRMITENEK